MEPTKKRRMPAEKRRAQLLDLALDIVVSEGFSALTIDRLAREAEITRTNIYTLFENHDGLMCSLVNREVEFALNDLKTIMALPVSTNLHEAANEYLTATLKMAKKSPKSWHLLLNPPESAPQELLKQISEGRQFARSLVSETLESRIYKPYDLEPKDKELTSYVVHLVLEDMVRQYLENSRRFSKARLLRLLENTMASFLPSDSNIRLRDIR